MSSITTRFNSAIHQIRYLNSCPLGKLPLHAPTFASNERQYVLDTIESTMVSSIGGYVTKFENILCEKTGSQFAVACVNGTAALEMAMRVAGVEANDLVITQSISFVATANAIRHLGAEPVFCDIEADTLGLSPHSLNNWLRDNCLVKNGQCFEKNSGKRVSACVPMHTCGLPCRIDEIVDICNVCHIPVIEDAAEALGSFYKGKSCGTFGLLGIFSFNGNKICTTGGGGAIITNDPLLAKNAKHLTTTAKIQHPWKFYHDEVGWNFRLPNINAALGVAQLECLEKFVAQKRHRAREYIKLFSSTIWRIIAELPEARSNYWLPALLVENQEQRDEFLEACHADGVQTRPLWEPLDTLPMYKTCMQAPLSVTRAIAPRIINLPNGCREDYKFDVRES